MQNISDLLFPSFKDNGKLTREEFIRAGDYLVHTCPTWSWSSAAPGKCAKQFLVTRNVPSIKEDSPLSNNDGDIPFEEDGDGFLILPFTDKVINDMVEDIDSDNSSGNSNGMIETEDIPDMDTWTSFHSNVVGVEDNDSNNDGDDHLDSMEWSPPVEDVSKNSNIIKTHTFDIYITYDKFYSTPHLWFNGFDSEGKVLLPSTIFDSFSSSHVNKTITIEIHHFLDIPMASVHPCRHSNAMKHIFNLMSSGGNGEGFRVDQYLIIFLKMMSSIIPNINYDHTMSL